MSIFIKIRARIYLIEVRSVAGVIEVKGLTKKYGDLTAVDHISFTVEHDEIFGLA